MGASTPVDYGDYFAWGEVQSKSLYIEKNSETYDKDDPWLRSNGYIDGNGKLTLSHDVAHHKWGGSWRLPTEKEIKELVNNTTAEGITLNGVKGRLVKSKINGNTIFFPAAGRRHNTYFLKVGEYGNYWSASVNKKSFYYSHSLNFYLANFESSWLDRSYGLPVRPVSD